MIFSSQSRSGSKTALLPPVLVGMIFLLSACATFSSIKVPLEKTAIPPTPALSENKALVYFYRPPADYGATAVFDITTKTNQVIGALGSGTYFFHQAAPGVATFSAKTEAEATLTMELEAGRQYYVRGGLKWGWLVPRPTLEVVSNAKGKAELTPLVYAVRGRATPLAGGGSNSAP